MICVRKSLILHYIGQDKEQGGHWLRAIGSNFGNAKTHNNGYR